MWPISGIFQRARSSRLVLVLLLLTSSLTLAQAIISGPSYAQFVTETGYYSGMSTTWHMHTGSRTWTWAGNRSFTWSGNVTWGYGGSHTWWSHTFNQTWTNVGNQTWNGARGNWTITHTGNMTWSQYHGGNSTWHGGGTIPGLDTGWARSNMTIAARNLTQPIFLNGTGGVRLSFIRINASSTGQTIRNVAFNASVAQIELDSNGSIQLTINSSAKPLQVFADDYLLPEAQSSVGLTPQSDVWVYDSNSQSLTIFADPTSVTLIYETASATASPVPEYPATLDLTLIGCIVITLLSVSTLGRPSRRHSLKRESNR